MHGADGLHPVVHKEDLPAALQLAQDSLAHQTRRVWADMGDDRQAFLRWCVDRGDISHPAQRHVQRARDGRGGQGEHIHFGAHLLERFLVRDAEALFFIDNQQTQFFNLHIRREQAVGADNDIDLPFGQPVDDISLLLGGAKAGEHLHLYREGCQPLQEGVVMLLGQDSGGHQDGDLLAVHHGFESGAQGNFCFAIAHIAANQAVHRATVLHIALDFRQDAHLVIRLDIRKTGFQFLLPGGIFCKSKALNYVALGVQAPANPRRPPARLP